MRSRATSACWATRRRFLTGMDEHSANLERAGARAGRRAAAAGRRSGPPTGRRAFDRLRDQLRPLHPHHRSRTMPAPRLEMVRRAHGDRRHLQGHLRRLVLHRRQRVQDRYARSSTATAPTIRPSSCSGWRRRTTSSACRATRSALEQLYREHPSLLRAGALPQRGARLAARGAHATSRSAAPATSWGIPFPDDPAHRIYVWFDALTNYLTGAGFPDDPASFDALVAGRPARHRQEHHPLPLPLLAGHADERRAAAAASRSSPTASC